MKNKYKKYTQNIKSKTQQQKKIQEENNFQYYLILETALISNLIPKQILDNFFFKEKVNNFKICFDYQA